MRHIIAILLGAKLRPFTIMFGAIIVLALIDRGTGYFFSVATAFSVLQLFATLGLVALGLGLTMLVREFDLSVAGMMGLAGCIAVMTGVENPWLGLVLGIVAGLVSGGLQGIIMTRLGVSSVGVTLGGLLTLQGMTYVLTGNRTINYPNLPVSLALSKPIEGLLSLRSAAALAVFVVVALVMAFTRIGRDVAATGGDRRASLIAGVKTDRVLVGVFMASGAFSALGGVLLSYSLGAASPAGLADVLAPAAAAAIIGGVSLLGGKGHPLGIAAGVLTLCILRSGFNAIGVPPPVHEVVTGAILLVIAIVDAPDLVRELTRWRLRRAERRAKHGAAQP
jgi:ribose/xylose/arabinose/galactoside ABC-type transport system permease subunit